MINHDVDIAVIGGGPAGLAAAISAKEHGAENIVILDRNSWLGGILPQCIHDGFGVEETGKSLTGPEYAEIYIDRSKERGIKCLKETMVLELKENREIIAINKKGFHTIKAKAIVLAMGCREKTRWNVMIPGDRPSGIYTAGVTQALINLYNIVPGKNVVVLGSGDVGLIMARRLKFEGVNVLGVVEMLPYASGLPRNVIQCLDDYDIPLFLNHTISNIKGRERLESVTVAQIDKELNTVPGTEKEISCDTLLLSLGLIPENELSKKVGIEIDKGTGGPIVDQCFETTLPGVFACGNCLQVYDTVDVLAVGAKQAGKHAAKFSCHEKYDKPNSIINVQPGNGILYVTPQRITERGVIDFTFRALKKGESVVFHLRSDKNEVYNKKVHWVDPANMIQISVNLSDEFLLSKKNLVVSLED